MMKVLITGGAVHGNLDNVKIITNKFKGGLIAKLADELIKKEDVQIDYLTSTHSVRPNNEKINVFYHDGFDDYMEYINKFAKDYDTIILGAAVANLIPVNPYQGKFPSHNYNEGDIVSIDFKIAPHIIDFVKDKNPTVNLFGFKLLSNVPHEELIRAAYKTVLNSKADAVFANDTNDLHKKYAVTKERSIIPLNTDNYVDFIYDAMKNQHYKTAIIKGFFKPVKEDAIHIEKFQQLKEKYIELIKATGSVDGLLFGTIAKRINMNTFITTARGKNEMDDDVIVNEVKGQNVCIYGSKKSTLNAPLLNHIFQTNPNVDYIVHYHFQNHNLPTFDYAFPGTVKDSLRDVNTSFNIRYHGAFLLYNNKGEQL